MAAGELAINRLWQAGKAIASGIGPRTDDAARVPGTSEFSAFAGLQPVIWIFPAAYGITL